MKPTKVRNNQIYRASYNTRSKQLGSPLSKDLQKKYGKRSIRITLGDTVKIIRGEYRGVDGKVSQVETSGQIAVEGIKKEKSQGEKFDIFIPTSNVVITGLNLDDHWRKTKLEGKKPKATPKQVKPEEPKEEKPKEAPAKKTEETPKKEAKSVKKSEKPKESTPEKKAKSKPTKKEKEAEE